MSAESLLPWRNPREGEHMAKTDYRDIIMVAGKDPYAYKGIERPARGVRAARPGRRLRPLTDRWVSRPPGRTQAGTPAPAPG